MNTITVVYHLKYRFKDYPHIQVTSSGEIFNIKTGRRKKMCVNGSSIGIWVTPKRFIIKSNLNRYLELIPKYEYNKKDFLINL